LHTVYKLPDAKPLSMWSPSPH